MGGWVHSEWWSSVDDKPAYQIATFCSALQHVSPFVLCDLRFNPHRTHHCKEKIFTQRFNCTELMQQAIFPHCRAYHSVTHLPLISIFPALWPPILLLIPIFPILFNSVFPILCQSLNYVLFINIHTLQSLSWSHSITSTSIHTQSTVVKQNSDTLVKKSCPRHDNFHGSKKSKTIA